MCDVLSRTVPDVRQRGSKLVQNSATYFMDGLIYIIKPHQNWSRPRLEIQVCLATNRRMYNLPSTSAGTGLDDVGLIAVVTECVLPSLDVELHVSGTSWPRRLSSVWNSSGNM